MFHPTKKPRIEDHLVQDQSCAWSLHTRKHGKRSYGETRTALQHSSSHNRGRWARKLRVQRSVARCSDEWGGDSDRLGRGCQSGRFCRRDPLGGSDVHNAVRERRVCSNSADPSPDTSAGPVRRPTHGPRSLLVELHRDERSLARTLRWKRPRGHPCAELVVSARQLN